MIGDGLSLTHASLPAVSVLLQPGVNVPGGKPLITATKPLGLFQSILYLAEHLASSSSLARLNSSSPLLYLAEHPASSSPLARLNSSFSAKQLVTATLPPGKEDSRMSELVEPSLPGYQ